MAEHKSTVKSQLVFSLLWGM